MLYSNSLISTEPTILSDRLYVLNIPNRNIDIRSNSKKRQITSTQYSILAPVIYTVNIINGTISIESVDEAIRAIDVSTYRNEIIGFNAVGTYVHICIYDKIPTIVFNLK